MVCPDSRLQFLSNMTYSDVARSMCLWIWNGLYRKAKVIYIYNLLSKYIAISIMKQHIHSTALNSMILLSGDFLMTGTHQYLNGPKWKSSIWAPMICQYYVGKGEVQARFLTVTNSMKKSVVWDKNTKFEVRFLVAKFNAYLYMDIDIWKCLLKRRHWQSSAAWNLQI